MKIKTILSLLTWLLFQLFLIECDAQEVKFTVSKEGWNADSLGNHRAIVRYKGTTRAVKVTVPWRRRDYNPQNKEIFIVDAKTNRRIQNVKRGTINRESGELIFEPVSDTGIYYVYYMPYNASGRSNYPKNTYPTPTDKAQPHWLSLLQNPANISEGDIIEIQSVDEFNSFYPMEIIATAAETQSITNANSDRPFIIFPEDRQYPVRMNKDLPYRWVVSGNANSFTGKACRGENYAFQLGVYAIRDVKNIRIDFSDFKSAAGQAIPASNALCINTDGVNWDGKPLTKRIDVTNGMIQAMWCLLEIPKEIEPGTYQGKAIISSDGNLSNEIELTIAIDGITLDDGGVSEPWKQTRLKWLNSSMAQKNEVIPPYTPLVINKNSISLLGRKVVLNVDGFPKQIQTFFTQEMTSIKDKPNEIISQPMQLIVKLDDINFVKWENEGFRFTEETEGTVAWEAFSGSERLNMKVKASLEFDGFMAYNVSVIAKRNIKLSDIQLVIPFNSKSSRYMMGLGLKGGYRPESFNWKWKVAYNNQDGAWIGDVNAGLQYSLRAENYIRPLNTNFYLQKPLNLPTSWGNEGKGGVSIFREGTTVVVNNYSGAREMKKGDTLNFNFTLLITPFHTLNTDFQWDNRFYHRYSPIDTVIQKGANIINIHHANEINPYINYPFIAHQKMKAYISEAHSKGLKVKIYNTVRELSNRAYETFPLRSLGHEIYSPGKGGGFSWLQEHLGDDYIAAWFVPELKDAAIINSGMSRWHNYYVEGLNWLVNNVSIDGLYLDDVAFDRTTMKRVKRVLTQNGHPGIIDLHSANQFNERDGFINSAMLYMEHFPYLNRLWFGEYFDYNNNPPEFFLTEVSGIPFGLMGEMLEGGGNPWRGMVYGMTNRMPWTENSDPRPIWQVWDDFGIHQSRMIGYWVDNNPVTTSNKDVIATIYKKQDTVLIALASWANDDTEIRLKIDWKALGMNPNKAEIFAPEIKDFQPEFTVKPDGIFTVPKGKGYLLILRNRK